MNINLGRTVIAGVIGTAVMTVVGLYLAPMMGLPPMNPAVMLAGAMGGNLALGWMAHFMIAMPVFSGSAALAMGSLVGHLVYGGVLGGIYGEATETATATAAV